MTARALRSALLPAWLSAAVGLAACDDSFEPIAPTHLQFSVFGYLDASADTQWIRVMPVRPLMVTSPDSFGATVTLEQVGTGRVVTLRDSVLRFSNHLHPGLGSDGVYLHNFWTTERIEAGAAYRFSARMDGREPSEAIVQIPREYDVEVWISQVSFEGDFLRLEGLKHVAFVSATESFYDRCGSGVHEASFTSRDPNGEIHMISVTRAEIPPREQCGAPTVDKRTLRAAGSEMAWPSGTGQSPSGLAVPEGASNISNSVGFLGGVLTRLVPYEDCTFQGGGPTVPRHCILRYDGASAAIRGTVRETRCNDGPIDSVTVTLREIDREPAEHRIVRTSVTDRAGGFEIAALEPGVRYALRVRPKPEFDPFLGEIDLHTVPTDTLVFTPGAQVRYDVAVQRFTACTPIA